MKKITQILVLLIAVFSNAQKFENLAQTPPQGWNSWNTFGTDINETLVKGIADKFIELVL
ncbi:hypothetical protein [Thalassobellus suaedae]|uniref:Uncharacterized protein n=1 Tax=Thalassobellus suaedae TaxID=3074124 RepID=A0ABY9XU37_9FLAO|nr:hypothetical protein RHP51_00765 [Flavobacteriaceae bacterium HL-DH14]